MQIISESLHVQDVYNIVIYRPGVGLLLIIRRRAYQSLSRYNIVYSFHAFFSTRERERGEFHLFKTR